jgi:hypothetical protein
MTALPTRQQIDRAAPLEFPERSAVRQELTITVHATIDGFPTEVCFSGSIDQLLGVTKRLRELGAAPTIVPAAPVQTTPARKPAERVQATYNGAGEPCCPKHNRALKEGQYGLYCSAKDDSTERGYCALKFKD